VHVIVDAPNGQRWLVRRRWPSGRWIAFVDGIGKGRRRTRAAMDDASRDAERDARSTAYAPAGNATVEVLANPSGLTAVGVGASDLVGSALLGIVELVVRLIVMPIALVGHVVFRRPWTIEATGDWVAPIRRSATGWQASRRGVDALVADLRSGAVTGPLLVP